MSARPKASRMERQVRNQARGLLLVSVMLLVACAAMTGGYGWGLGRTWVESFVFAMAFVGADLGGAVLMSTAGTYSANKEPVAARWAFAAAIACMLMTLSGIIGFQSESREAQAASRQKAAAVAEKFSGWATEMAEDTLKKQQEQLSKGKKPAPADAAGLSTTLGTVWATMKDQILMLQSGQLAATADGQATTISRLTGMSEERSRSVVVGSGSGVLLIIQYALLWCYGFTRQKVEPAIAARNSVISHQFATANSANSQNQAELSEGAVREDFNRLVVEGFDPTKYGAHSFLSRRWGWSNHRVGRWLRNQPDLNVPPPAKRSAKKHLNGSGNGSHSTPIIPASATEVARKKADA